MRNQIQNESLSKNNTKTKSLYLENSINTSNVLTSNQFYQHKGPMEPIISEEKNIIKPKNETEIKIKEYKNIGNNIGTNFKELKDDTLIIHNKFLNDKAIKPKLKKVNSEVELFQDYILEDYKNQNINDQRNVIEKLGACVEKKYSNIKFWRINNERNNKLRENLSIRMRESNPINEYNKNSSLFLSKRPKHSYSTSHILDSKNKDSFPMLINSPLNYEKKFSSFSEKERNEKNVSALIKLKHYLSMYWKQRKEIISEFFKKNNIYGNFFYKDKHLFNFSNFINDNVFDDKHGTKCSIETRYPMIEIVLKGINYKPNFDKKRKDINKINQGNQTSLRKNSSIRESIDFLNKEKEKADFIESKDRLEKFRNYLNRNYKKSVIDKMLKGLSKQEKLIYFSEKKYGEIEIVDKKNLVNNIHKQALYQKIYDSLMKEEYSKKSIKLFDNDDLKKLNEELKVAKDSVFSKSIKQNRLREQEKALGIKNLRLNDKIIDKLNQRLYYTTKEKFHQKHPEIIPKKKQKLLEYVIAQRIKERKDYMDKFHQNNS